MKIEVKLPIEAVRTPERNMRSAVPGGLDLSALRRTDIYGAPGRLVDAFEDGRFVTLVLDLEIAEGSGRCFECDII